MAERHNDKLPNAGKEKMEQAILRYGGMNGSRILTGLREKTTGIDEILIMRESKRINSQIRKHFNNYNGRKETRESYLSYLEERPYSSDIFRQFIEHIISQTRHEILDEDDVIKTL